MESKVDSIPFEYRGRAWSLDGRRRCSRCKEWLEPVAFRPNPKMRDGLNSWCRSCMVASTQEWRAKYRPDILAKRRKRWSVVRDELNARRREKYANSHRRQTHEQTISA